MKANAYRWLSSVFVLLYMIILVVMATLYFVRPPAAEVSGTAGIVGAFAVLLAIIGLLAGKGLPYFASAALAVLLACILPSWLWLTAACGERPMLALSVLTLPVAVRPVLRHLVAVNSRVQRI